MLGLIIGVLLSILGVGIITDLLYWPVESVLYALHLPNTTAAVGMVGLAAFTSGSGIITAKLWPR